MKIERHFIKENMEIYYCLTDNKCMYCKHNPKNRNPYTGCDGNCNKCNENVVECYKFENMNETVSNCL